MWPRAIHLYVLAMCAAALLAFTAQDWSLFFEFPSSAIVGFGALTVLGLLSEATSFRFRIAGGVADSSIAYLPLLACVLLFGSPAAVLFYAINGVIVEVLVRRKEMIRAAFNISQYIIATTVAGLVFTGLGGEPLALQAESGADVTFKTQLVPFSGFAFSLIAVNHSAVSLAIALSEQRSFRSIVQSALGKSGSNILHAILISPLGILVAFLYFELQVFGLLVSLLPIFFVRYAYLHTHQLQEANRDLLKVLVKAIETRDPYTSGHSVRVQELAERIAEAMGLSGRTVEEVTTAALLHDIGKIDVVYEGILQKPGKLSEEERQVIRSHVTRGVEIITSLSPFNSRIIDAVRHHHERVDGTGYPDGLAGEDIPVGGRIIHVCDAVDAMLSDRPYRKALSVEEVKKELLSNRGTQFDSRVVDVLVTSKILDTYVRDMTTINNIKDIALDPVGRL